MNKTRMAVAIQRSALAFLFGAIGLLGVIAPAAVLSAPSVSIIPPTGPLSETSSPYTGSFLVRLSEPFTNSVTVGLTVSPSNSAANGTVMLQTNRAYFALGSTEVTVRFSARDGTDLSSDTGFTVTPTVLSSAAAIVHYVDCLSGLINIQNVAPVIASPLASDSVTYTIPQGTLWTYYWSLLDVVPDLPSMKVTWSFGDGQTRELTGGSGLVTHVYEAVGELGVRLAAQDKDGGRSEVQFKVNVVPSKTVRVTPVGPNLEANYWGAIGLGNGLVSSAEAYGSANRNNMYSFRYSQMAASATLQASPYKAGRGWYAVTNFNSVGEAVPGAFTMYDSFFFVWVGAGQGLAEQHLNPATASPNAVVALADVDRDIHAIFSREYRVADNAGDINLDGIPDQVAFGIESHMNVETNGSGALPFGLTNLTGYNLDEDGEGNAVGDFLPIDPAGAQGRFDFRPISDGTGGNPFTAFLEVRGFHPGLNSYLFGSDPDYETEYGEDEPQTDPTRVDTDGDSFPDGWEYYFWYNARIKNMDGCAYDPLNVAEGSLIPSRVIEIRFDPHTFATSADVRDLDNDGLLDVEELSLGTNPTRWDTDGDGLSDSWEASRDLDPGDAIDAVPTFIPGTGSVATNTILVRLSTVDGAEIRYTLDGSMPTASSDLYESAQPLLLTQSATVNARAFRPGMLTNATATAVFTVIHLATCYYVDASRPDDGGDGMSWTTAKRSIQAAVDLAYDGDTVWVTNGVYDSGGAVAPEASLSNRVAICGAITVRSVNGAEGTVIKGSGAETYETEAAMRCVYLDGGVLDGFTLRDGATRTWEWPDRCGGGALVADGVVRNCVILNNAALEGGGVYGGELENALVCGNGGGSGLCNTLAYNSVVYGNAGTGIQGGALYNSIVWANETPYSELDAPFEMLNCCMASWPQNEAFRNNVSADPLFVDAANGNFRLRSDSPCLDAGDSAFVQAPVDLDGNPRIVNDRVDMGAYESGFLTVSLDAEGGAVNPEEVTVTYGSAYGPLPTPVRAGYSFGGWWLGDGGTGVRAHSSTPVTKVAPHSLYAKWTYGLPPVWVTWAPSANPMPVNEGASVAFSVKASDSGDPDLAMRGMSNITWYVDGEMKQVTKTGAPNAITSAFTFKTATNTVVGVASRDVVVAAVALDRQGYSTATNWTVRVNNMPAAQTITFKAFPVMALGTTNFNPGASASSGLQVAYANANPAVAEIVDGLIRIVGAGTTIITASQPGNIDFKAATPVKQTLKVMARLTAEVLSGAGTVTGAGLHMPGTKVALTAKPAANNTFLRWEDGSQATSRSLLMPNANVAVAAWFGLTTNVPKPVIDNPGPLRGMVGVFFNRALDIQSESLPTVTVTGLPSGLKYVPVTKTIEGVPTAAALNKPVTVTAKNVNKTAAVPQTFNMTVDPLPAWAQGAFNGAAGTEAHGAGSASLSVTALGALSGKLSLRGTNFSFSAKNYASRDADGAFLIAVTAAVGKASMPLSLAVGLPAVSDVTGTVPATLGRADGALAGDGRARLWRNVWKDAGMAAVLTNYAGYYTATLPVRPRQTAAAPAQADEAAGLIAENAEAGSGYLLITVDKAGGVKATGKLADGTAVSLGGPLVLDESGRVFAVLYTSPAAYKGGGLFGLAEFVKPEGGGRVFARVYSSPFLWESFNPQATANPEAGGFSRSLVLTGGWYDTVGNLYAYYKNRTLGVGADGAPVPTLLVGTNRYDAACWDADGLALAVVTNKGGVMTGLAAPKAGVPVDPDKDGEWDYGATNTVGLTIGLTRATGVFKGSFKAWFDYPKTHTSKTVAYEGVLTPEREDPGDGVAGRGFFLWADKSQYLNAQDKPVPYGFSWSYDLKILLSETP